MINEAAAVWLFVALFVLACGAAGLAISLRWQVVVLRRRLMRAWRREADERRRRRVLEALRERDLATFDRRVARWRDYAIGCQDALVEHKIMTAWKAQADRQSMPFVESGAAPLDG